MTLALKVTDPVEVAENVAYLQSLGVWHRVSTNRAAHSCADAASKRKRLGNIGIPLFDELKSHVGRYEKGGAPQYLLAHCRGHQLRDEGKLAAIAGAPVERVQAEELASEFGLEYGRINPFFFARCTDVPQIFDRSVVERYFSPHTMMTNCGDLEYGVEFDSRQLVRALPNATVADIVIDDFRHPVVDHTLGILTGNGPESGIALWQRINDRIRDTLGRSFRGDTDYPHVIIESLPDMGLSMELEWREAEVRATVLEGIKRLCWRGATVIGVACNTTQYFSDEIRDICTKQGAAFVSIVDETAFYLERNEILAFDLLGIGAVSDLSRWSDFRRIPDILNRNGSPRSVRIVVPSETAVSRITDLAFEVKRKDGSDKTDLQGPISRLGNLIKESTSTDTVLLALTELSIVAEREPRLEKQSGKCFVDTLSLLANRMAEIYLAERLALQRPPRPSASWETE